MPVKAIYNTEINHLMEQALSYAQELIRKGESDVVPFCIIFPENDEPELHRFETKGKLDVPLVLESVDGHILKRSKKKPKPHYAVIGYTDRINKKASVILEGYAVDTGGLFKVTQSYNAAKGKVSFSKNAELNFFKGHNPVNGLLGRDAIRKAAFQKS